MSKYPKFFKKEIKLELEEVQPIHVQKQISNFRHSW